MYEHETMGVNKIVVKRKNGTERLLNVNQIKASLAFHTHTVRHLSIFFGFSTRSARLATVWRWQHGIGVDMSNTVYGVNAYELKLCIIIDYCYLQSNWMFESRNKCGFSVLRAREEYRANAGDLHFD